MRIESRVGRTVKSNASGVRGLSWSWLSDNRGVVDLTVTKLAVHVSLRRPYEAGIDEEADRSMRGGSVEVGIMLRTISPGRSREPGYHEEHAPYQFFRQRPWEPHDTDKAGRHGCVLFWLPEPAYLKEGLHYGAVRSTSTS